MNILLANPRGFCAGVDRAIAIVERAIELFGAPIYVRHEVVHNRYVVDCLKAKGAVFVDELQQVPDEATVIFSAHGVSQSVRAEAEGRGLRIFDATCPLVTKVHFEVARHSRDHEEVVLIGHRGHPEVEGTLGQYSSAQGGMYLVEKVEDVEKLQIKNSAALYFVTQTTLSVDDTQQIIEALRTRYPDIRCPKKDDICFATQNRQDAVKEFASECDLILVIGSQNSSNSNRLREIGERLGIASYLIDDEQDIQLHWFDGVMQVGITAGASAPEHLVERVVSFVQQQTPCEVRQHGGKTEDILFSIPKELLRG